MNRQKGITLAYSTRQIDPAYRSHLRATCGVNNLELVPVENKGEFSLAKVYNDVVAASMYDIVVLVHDDLIFHTPNWGRKLLKQFNETTYGIIGLAGTTDLQESGCWWERQERMVGQVRHLHEGKTHVSRYSNNFGNALLATVLVDGLFIALHKERIKSTFDEQIPGFHFYDVSFCVRNRFQGVQIGVSFAIEVTHKSIGRIGDAWQEARKLFLENYAPLLPMRIEPPISFIDKPVYFPKRQPKVTVIIPNKDSVDLLTRCIRSIVEQTHYTNYEIIVADTGSQVANKEAIRAMLVSIRENNVPTSLAEFSYYHFARINNAVVQHYVAPDTDLLLFVNNDIELVNDCISRMVRTWLENPQGTGTLGARLYYGDNSIQHSGIIGMLDTKTHQFGVSHYGLGSYHTYYEAPRRGILGNTGTFLMLEKRLFESIGGFNEKYEECFEDVELNMSVLLQGKENVLVGDAVAYHLESQTRKNNPNMLEGLQADYRNNLVPFLEKHFEALKKYITLY